MIHILIRGGQRGLIRQHRSYTLTQDIKGQSRIDLRLGHIRIDFRFKMKGLSRIDLGLGHSKNIYI